MELAAAVTSDSLNRDGIAALDDTAAIATLRNIRGVGHWTAEYALLRGLGRLHVFPGDDVGARNALRRWLGIEEPLDYDGVRRLLAPLRRTYLSAPVGHRCIKDGRVIALCAGKSAASRYRPDEPGRPS